MVTVAGFAMFATPATADYQDDIREMRELVLQLQDQVEAQQEQIDGQQGVIREAQVSANPLQSSALRGSPALHRGVRAGDRTRLRAEHRASRGEDSPKPGPRLMTVSAESFSQRSSLVS